MKIINVEQGSPAWLDWRKTVITGTDCPAILGSSKWATPYKCWQRKLGLIKEQASNDAMERGKRLEPEARAHFIERYGIDMKPAVVESTGFEFLGASLDGLSDFGTSILEIKCGGAKLHEMAAQGIIPEYYLDQMQHQLLVTGVERCFYYSYDGKDGICINVYPDPDFLDKWIPKARAFWKCVAFMEPPALETSDYRDMGDSFDWKHYAKEYVDVNKAIKDFEDKKDYLRKKLIELCAEQSSAGGGIKVMKTMMRGRVNYDEIPEIQGIDLDKYRKSATNSWKILIE
jgi:putative phage-type endonuclease